MSSKYDERPIDSYDGSCPLCGAKVTHRLTWFEDKLQSTIIAYGHVCCTVVEQCDGQYFVTRGKQCPSVVTQNLEKQDE